MASHKENMKKYLERYTRLSQLTDDERIYLNVDYWSRQFAKMCHCVFDKEKKLWYAGYDNEYLPTLVESFGINPITTEKALALAKGSLGTKSETEET